MTEKLLPCPFCGGANLSTLTHDVKPEDYHGGYVTCLDCDAQGADAATLNGWLSSPEEASNAAMVAWNTRHREQAEQETVAKIVAWLRDQWKGRLQSPVFLANAIEAGEWRANFDDHLLTSNQFVDHKMANMSDKRKRADR